jgi:hypothetical protein
MNSKYDEKKLKKIGLSLRKIADDTRVNRHYTTVRRILRGEGHHSTVTKESVFKVIDEAKVKRAKLQRVGVRKAAKH